MMFLLLLITGCAYRVSEVKTMEETIDTVIQEPPKVKTEIIEEEVPVEVRRYRVWIWQENRDCLWNIAKRVYGNPYMWKKIYEANKDIIKNPNLIFPKQVLLIP
ncbi:MAG: LysM peptidoglycan-binding domain-containing protein [bacterium]|nr:LysM peptidoglycan-binding domain-containing protein [bacterium]